MKYSSLFCLTFLITDPLKQKYSSVFFSTCLLYIDRILKMNSKKKVTRDNVLPCSLTHGEKAYLFFSISDSQKNIPTCFLRVRILPCVVYASDIQHRLQNRIMWVCEKYVSCQLHHTHIHTREHQVIFCCCFFSLSCECECYSISQKDTNEKLDAKKSAIAYVAVYGHYSCSRLARSLSCNSLHQFTFTLLFRIFKSSTITCMSSTMANNSFCTQWIAVPPTIPLQSVRLRLFYYHCCYYQHHNKNKSGRSCCCCFECSPTFCHVE